MEDKFSRNENPDGRIVDIGSYKERTGRAYRKKSAVRVQVEVSCNEAVGEAIRTRLTEELGKLDGVIIVDEAPGWVFSIIAFHYGQLVELSVILRQFFRASKPGTEQDTITPGGAVSLKSGAWVYESLKFHGLFGVQVSDLKGLFASLAEEFGKNHLGQASKKKLPDRSEGYS
jgi:hypothetical protein